MAVETSVIKVNKVKVALIGTALVVSVGVGIVGEDNLIEDNELYGYKFTDNEYKQIKRDLIDRVKNRGDREHFDTIKESQMWIELVNKEIPCLKQLTGVTEENLIDKLNEKLELGC